MLMHERIKAERERLGLSRVAFADLVNAHPNSISNWENGHRFPDARVLRLWANHGVDVLYVITGERSKPVPPPVLSPEEQQLLDAYRHSNKQSKAVLMASLALASDNTA